MFNPKEIIFSATTACNLHCSHCFVQRKNLKLNIDDSISFLESASSDIERIGFSGGEPFLYFDFILALTKAAIKKDMLFDQIMTNGDWWKDEAELEGNLQQLYDAGYDGKIGLSWDSFHGQATERMVLFIKTVQNIFGEDSISIQRVESEPSKKKKNENTSSPIPDDIVEKIPVYTLPQCFPASDVRAWQGKKWFKDDYCEGPGQILFIHPDGNIAPCCGFANENEELYIGNIKQNYQTVMKQAYENKMIQICYEIGLGKYKKTLKKNLRKNKLKYPGKCSDMCSFCDFVCKNLNA